MTETEQLIERASYMIENPSAWDTFDQRGSDMIAALVKALTAWNTRPDEGEPVAWLGRSEQGARWHPVDDPDWYRERGWEVQALYTRPAPALDREGVARALFPFVYPETARVLTFEQLRAHGMLSGLLAAADAILAMVGGGVPAGWQDATTAPKDGTPFMVWAPGFEWPEIVKWQAYSVEDAEEVGEPGYWTYAEEMLANVVDSVEADQWTHWSPLPASPVEG
jgi:hypothetical protein